jgi:formate hydrogenlyase subunit 6/NADH:ubiquinone oxidoreductase subunit I
MSTYFKNISRGITTTLKGMSLTLRHFWNARHSRKPYAMQDSSYFDLKTGIVTLQYPHQTLPVPDNGRYQLDCEIDDCIVCDKCAKICPVDCIDIEPIKSSEVISYTSDGSPVRLYAAKFDIDMAKCCFCGLCTTVCPTECLTMTNEYDFSVVDITQMNFGFSNLSADQADKKRKLYEQFVAEKEALKAMNSNQSSVINSQVIIKDEKQEISKPKTAFKPNFKPAVKPVENTTIQEVKEEKIEITTPKPAFKPSFKPVTKPVEAIDSKEELPKPTPVFKPSFKPALKIAENSDNTEHRPKAVKEDKQEMVSPKPVFKPTFKPKFTQPTITGNIDVAHNTAQSNSTQEIPKSKPVFKPGFKITPKKD